MFKAGSFYFGPAFFILWSNALILSDLQSKSYRRV